MEDIIKKAEFVNAKRLEEYKVEKIAYYLTKKLEIERDYKAKMESIEADMKKISEMTHIETCPGALSYGRGVADLLSDYQAYVNLNSAFVSATSGTAGCSITNC